MLSMLAAHSRTRLWWLGATLVLALIVIIFHLYAIENFWYWKYRWFDIPMHILGGLTVGAFCIGLSGDRRPIPYLAAMVLIAAGWEVMEYVSGITSTEGNYLFDTFHDLLDDSVGAVLAYLLARFTIGHSA